MTQKIFNRFRKKRKLINGFLFYFLQNEANYGKINKITHKNLMTNTISNNPLDELVFKDDTDFKTFENILESLDHVIPKKVSREEFNQLYGDFLVETWEDPLWKKYDLFLPEDLQRWELLNCIFFLSQKFWLEEYTPNESIITQVKVMIAIILRNIKEEDTEAYFLWLASKYHLSSEFVERIKNEKMILSEAKQMVREIRGKKWDKERLWSDEDVILWSDELSDLFQEQFELSFFRKWINMLRLGMMTITGAEQEAKIKYCEENWFEKETSNNWGIKYKKWGEIIIINVSSELLDTKERLLRNKIWISEWIEKLEQARNSGNKEERAKIEFEASEAIIKVLYEYMYQLTEKNNWYQPSKMWEQKEIYCVWYSLLWHAFLSELWIEHYWLDNTNHSAIEVVIWWKTYLFDVAKIDHVLEFEYWEKKWEYHEIVWKWWSLPQREFAKRWNVEKILFSQIYNNKWFELSDFGNKEEAMEMFDKSIELNPRELSAYYNKWLTLFHLWRKEEAIEMFDKAIELHPTHAMLHFNKWLALFQLWRTEESTEMFDKIIEFNPRDAHAYNNKWLALEKLWKKKLSKLYKYASTVLKWTDSFLDISYRKEKWIIKQFIASKDYEWLRNYLRGLEKKAK